MPLFSPEGPARCITITARKGKRHVVQFSSHINTRHDQPLGPSLQYYISGEAGRSREDVSASYESVGSAKFIAGRISFWLPEHHLLIARFRKRLLSWCRNLLLFLFFLLTRFAWKGYSVLCSFCRLAPWIELFGWMPIMNSWRSSL